ncbi:Replication protein A 70 kDa DNA-binding subunit [Gracilariopsis chorda]|uniref:Replication protein A subunit n=1 Tax=Gracilariopsis chorda TaxID=448386 RepID=A0A2V3IRT1_9FLOR|nr:Replication protein A 70 kDa DNA-binding subunit [Gracilariopsis chorda]|eukprot:PXF44836.1 Replication protein A 70 kDa DNA-binding subunit [Gracilariopsis chorda]
MAGVTELTRGAIAHIHKTGQATGEPLLQVVDMKLISPANPASTTNAPRYRFGLSDGVHFMQAITASQLTTLITEGRLKSLSLIRLKEFICNNINNKCILIVLNLDVITQLPTKVGNPVNAYSALGQQNQPVNTMAQPQTSYAPPNAGMPSNGNHAPAPGGYGSRGFGQPNNFEQPRQNGFSSVGFGGNGNQWNAPKSYSNGPISKMGSTPTGFFRPIQNINPYQNGWTIRGRCTYKSDLRKFQNARGEGQVISFELTDESGSIRITGFTQRAPEIYEKVHLNRLYKVSRGQLKQANERFNRSTSNFEMTLDTNSQLEEIGDDGSFMQINYNFTKIASLDSIDVKGNCDVVGIVTGIGPVSEIIIRSTGEPCPRRSITLTDDSKSSVELTLWRKQAETFLTEADLARHPVLLLRNAQRGDFGGVNLNVSRMTTIEKDPVDIPEANKLRAWFDGGGLANVNVQSVTSGMGGGGKITGERKTLERAKAEDVDPTFSGGSGGNGATATFVTRGVISFISTKGDMYYPGDPESKKKVVQYAPGIWTNESSGRQLSDTEIVWRYIISMKIMDSTSSEWASGFDEVGQVLFGRSADELRQLKEKDSAMFQSILDDATFRPLLMKMQVKERMWQNALKVRYTVSRAELVDFASEGHQLLKEIAAYGGM